MPHSSRASRSSHRSLAARVSSSHRSGVSGPAASDLSVTNLIQKNSSGHGATGSISPASGGLLFAAVTTDSPSVVSWTPGGTLTGTWTMVTAIQTSSSRSNAIFTCPDYGASGTVSFVSGVGNWTQIGVYRGSSASNQLVTDGTIRQSKSANPAGAVSASWTSLPTYGTFCMADSLNVGTWVPGTGWTQLVLSSTFSALGSMWSQPGQDPIAYAHSQASVYVAVEFKRNP